MAGKTHAGMPQWQRAAKKVRQLGWVIWSVAIVAQFLNQLHRVAAAAAVDRIMADFDITAAAIGGVLAMYFYVYAAMQIPSGILADYVGPRKTMTYGCLVTCIGSVTFGLAPSLSVLYLGRFLVTLGVSVIFVGVLKLQTEWFHSRQFARMSSLTAFIGNSGGLIGTTPIALLIMWVGWRFSFESLGFFSLVVCLACWLVIRNRPADLGLPSPAEIARHELGLIASAPLQGTAATGFGQRLKIMLTNKYVWFPFLIGVGLYGTILVIQGAWGIPYLMQVYSMTRDSAANFMLLTLAGFMVGGVTVAFISDKIQRRKLPAIICAFGYLSMWIMLTFWNGGKPPVPALYPIFLLMGYFAGFTPVIYACAKEVVPPFIAGMVMGLVNMSVFVSAAVLQILFGEILDLGWQGALLEGARIYPLAAFQSGFIIVCIAVFASVVGALLLKETRCRDTHNQI